MAGECVGPGTFVFLTNLFFLFFFTNPAVRFSGRTLAFDSMHLMNGSCLGAFVACWNVTIWPTEMETDLLMYKHQRQTVYYCCYFSLTCGSAECHEAWLRGVSVELVIWKINTATYFMNQTLEMTFFVGCLWNLLFFNGRRPLKAFTPNLGGMMQDSQSFKIPFHIPLASPSY